MVRLIIRHVSGSRETEIDVVELGAHREIIFGRAPSAAVRFDARRDGIVGRHHARLDWDPGQPMAMQLADLQSRNGTWINGQRMEGPAQLRSGDQVQLGRGGPVFEVQLEVEASLAAIGDQPIAQPIRPLS
ncbi:MAG: FHA domain-containing protein [Gemmatimonadaceae bacterium]|nr:FHA domain-containing protein [Gemmatimonadaceae bacterium]